MKLPTKDYISHFIMNNTHLFIAALSPFPPNLNPQAKKQQHYFNIIQDLIKFIQQNPLAIFIFLSEPSDIFIHEF
jgi:hypothetical protein